MTDKNLARKQAMRMTSAPSPIDYGRPEYAGEVLMGSPNGQDGMEWSDDITAKSIRYSLNNSRDIGAMEAIVLEGTQQHYWDGSDYSQFKIIVDVPNLIDNLVGAQGLASYQDEAWRVKTPIFYNNREVIMSSFPESGATSSSSWSRYRIILWVLKGHSHLSDDRNTEV